MTPETDFAVFLATRNAPKVKRERFVPTIATTLAREYDNTTEKNLLFIRTQGKTDAAEAAGMSNH